MSTEKQNDTLHIFVKPSEHEAWRMAAHRVNAKSKTQWIRDTLNKAAGHAEAPPVVRQPQIVDKVPLDILSPEQRGEDPEEYLKRMMEDQ